MIGTGPDASKLKEIDFNVGGVFQTAISYRCVLSGEDLPLEIDFNVGGVFQTAISYWCALSGEDRPLEMASHFSQPFFLRLGSPLISNNESINYRQAK